MYKIKTSQSVSAEQQTSVIRCNLDGSFTSFSADPANTDYQQYLKWLEEGNTPELAEESQA